MTVRTLEAALESAIHDALNTQLKAIVEQEIAEAQKRVATRLHEHVATTAMRISRFYEMARMEDRVVITVRDGSKP